MSQPEKPPEATTVMEALRERDPRETTELFDDAPDFDEDFVEGTAEIDPEAIAREEAGGEDCLVCIHGGPLGRAYKLGEREQVSIGRGPECPICIEDATISREHAEVRGEPGGRIVADLGSTNGIILNGNRIERSPLRSGDVMRMGAVVLKYLSGGDIENVYHEEVHRISTQDGLTQVANRDFFEWSIEREFSRAKRHQRPLSLLMIDVDHFKQINDGHGHLAGDSVLARAALLMRHRLRKEDCLARFGGDEFCVLLPETAIMGGRACALALAEIVRNYYFTFEGARLRVSLSIGVATRKDEMEEAKDLLQAADASLYKAKGAGRDRVYCEELGSI
jgi:two-component system, cell cycle response regulator